MPHPCASSHTTYLPVAGGHAACLPATGHAPSAASSHSEAVPPPPSTPHAQRVAHLGLLALFSFAVALLVLSVPARASDLGDEVAWLAVRMAGTAEPEDRISAPNNNPWTRISDSRLQNLFNVMDADVKAQGGNCAYGSCNQAAAGVIAATVDPAAGQRYASNSPQNMMDWMASNTECFREVDATSISQLEPGDILVQNNSHVNHTMIYVGTAAAREKFPGTTGYFYEASYGDSGSGPAAYSYYAGITNRWDTDKLFSYYDFRVFRPIAKKSGATFIDYESIIGEWRSGTLVVGVTSALPDMTEGNSCYALSGAHLGVYQDKACTTKLASLTTGADGRTGGTELSGGTYYLRVTEAPRGFEAPSTVREVTVGSGSETTAGFELTPLCLTKWQLLSLEDAETGTSPQGDATLAGAVVELSYFDNTDAAEGDAHKTWQLTSDGTGAVSSETQDAGAQAGAYWKGDVPVLPLGTYVLEVETPPTGYLTSQASVVAHVRQASEGSCELVFDDAGKAGSDNDGAPCPTIPLQVVRGSVSLDKQDAETGLKAALGSATLAGATFEVENLSDAAVVVDGTSYVPGEVSLVIETGVDGRAQNSGTGLPYGTYRIHEASAPLGYLLQQSWSADFSVGHQAKDVYMWSGADGEVIDVTAGNALEEQVIRGGFRFVRRAGDTMASKSGAAFLVVAASDGDGDGTHEAHVVVCDANGIFDPSNYAPADRDNANDGAVSGVAITEDAAGNLTVDLSGAEVAEDALSSSHGAWFTGRTDIETSQIEGLEAFPFDTYVVAELPTSANQGKNLTSFTVSLTNAERNHGLVADLGTILDTYPTGVIGGQVELLATTSGRAATGATGGDGALVVTAEGATQATTITATGTATQAAATGSSASAQGTASGTGATVMPQTGSGLLAPLLIGAGVVVAIAGFLIHRRQKRGSGRRPGRNKRRRNPTHRSRRSSSGRYAIRTGGR